MKSYHNNSGFLLQTFCQTKSHYPQKSGYKSLQTGSKSQIDLEGAHPQIQTLWQSTSRHTGKNEHTHNTIYCHLRTENALLTLGHTFDKATSQQANQQKACQHTGCTTLSERTNSTNNTCHTHKHTLALISQQVTNTVMSALHAHSPHCSFHIPFTWPYTSTVLWPRPISTTHVLFLRVNTAATPEAQLLHICRAAELHSFPVSQASNPLLSTSLISPHVYHTSPDPVSIHLPVVKLKSIHNKR